PVTAAVLGLAVKRSTCTWSKTPRQLKLRAWIQTIRKAVRQLTGSSLSLGRPCGASSFVLKLRSPVFQRSRTHQTSSVPIRWSRTWMRSTKQTEPNRVTTCGLSENSASPSGKHHATELQRLGAVHEEQARGVRGSLVGSSVEAVEDLNTTSVGKRR